MRYTYAHIKSLTDINTLYNAMVENNTVLNKNIKYSKIHIDASVVKKLSNGKLTNYKIKELIIKLFKVFCTFYNRNGEYVSLKINNNIDDLTIFDIGNVFINKLHEYPWNGFNPKSFLIKKMIFKSPDNIREYYYVYSDSSKLMDEIFSSKSCLDYTIKDNDIISLIFKADKFRTGIVYDSLNINFEDNSFIALCDLIKNLE